MIPNVFSGKQTFEKFIHSFNFSKVSPTVVLHNVLNSKQTFEKFIHSFNFSKVSSTIMLHVQHSALVCVCCSALQCVAACCSVLQFDVREYSRKSALQ